MIILVCFTLCQMSDMPWPAAHLAVLPSFILAGSACIQEHGQVHHPQGYCAALGGCISIQAPLPVIMVYTLWVQNETCYFSPSVGSHCTEAGNNPPEKETAALHGPKSRTFDTSNLSFDVKHESIFMFVISIDVI